MYKVAPTFCAVKGLQLEKKDFSLHWLNWRLTYKVLQSAEWDRQEHILVGRFNSSVHSSKVFTVDKPTGKSIVPCRLTAEESGWDLTPHCSAGDTDTWSKENVEIESEGQCKDAAVLQLRITRTTRWCCCYSVKFITNRHFSLICFITYPHV